MGGLIGVATAEKNGLATVDMAKALGVYMDVNNKTYVKITQLREIWSYSCVEIVSFRAVNWSKEAVVKLIVAITAEQGEQTAKATLICGDKGSVSLYKGSDNFLYVKHNFTSGSIIYVSMKLPGNTLIGELITTPPELTEIAIS